MKTIILGGVAAGMSAATKIKRIEKNAEVTVYEKGDILSYGACGLPYYVGGYNDDYHRMIMRSQEEFTAAGIRSFLAHEAIEVNSRAQTVIIKNLKTGKVFTDRYDKLLISTGASPSALDIPGFELEGIYSLKTIGDGICLYKAAREADVKDVIVIGGGYIGIEMAEVIHSLSKRVTVIESQNRLLSSFDCDIADLAESELLRHDVVVRKSEDILLFEGENSVRSVVTDKGVYAADLVIVAAGVSPNTGFLAGSGIGLSQRGAVMVDREMKTDTENVYAAGDCSMVYHAIKKRNDYIPLGTNANKCGRLAGDNICGASLKYDGTIGSAALQVMDLQLGRTGLSESEAVECELAYRSVKVETTNHPPYYPGQKKLIVKLIYEKNSYKILGAQLAGEEGVALRTDIFATAITSGMTTKALGMADLVYAPPYSNVWDAVHIAANAAK